MIQQPTIWDLIGWQKGGEEGQLKQAEYFESLIGEEGLDIIPQEYDFTVNRYEYDPGGLGAPSMGWQKDWDWEKQLKTTHDIEDLSIGEFFDEEVFGGKDFQDLSTSDIEEYIKGSDAFRDPDWYQELDEGYGDTNRQLDYYDEANERLVYKDVYNKEQLEGAKYGQAPVGKQYSGVGDGYAYTAFRDNEGVGKTQEKDYANWIKAIQELFKGTTTFEEYGGAASIADMLQGSERKEEAVRQRYIPKEIINRFQKLQQGTSGGGIEDTDKYDYMADIASSRRGIGRDVRNIYEDYGDVAFGDIDEVLANLEG